MENGENDGKNAANSDEIVKPDEQNDETDPYRRTYPPQSNPAGENRPADPALADAMRLTTMALIVAIVSLFFGGVLLDAVALGMGFMASRKLNDIGAGVSAAQAGVARKRVRTALVVAGAALVLNLVSMFVVFPMLMQALQSGDLGTMLPMGGSASSGGSTSIWDK